MAARKAWNALSKSYQKRMARNGLTARNWATPQGDALRKAARGHKDAPEHPQEAAKAPAKFPKYVQKLSDEMRQLKARKERIFGSSIKYRQRGSDKNAEYNPRTEGPPNRAYVRRFLRMSEMDVLDIDWSDDEWGFLFYH